jgi:acyl dehydratase
MDDKGVTDRPALLLTGRCWQDQPVGFRFRTGRRTITEADLVGFVTLCGFIEGLFLDAEASRGEAGYAGRLVPGALVFSMAEGLVVQSGAIAGTGVAYLGANMEVLGPVFVDDTIEVHVTVTESRASRTPGRGVVVTRNEVVNQRGELVQRYTPARLVRGREDVDG